MRWNGHCAAVPIRSNAAYGPFAAGTVLLRPHPHALMVTIDKIDELKERLEALKGYLAIEDKRGRILEEEKYTLDPDFWNDQKKAQQVMHRIRELKRWVGLYENVKREIDDLEVTFEFFKAKEVSEEELDAQFKKANDALEELEDVRGVTANLDAEESWMEAVMA